MASEGNGPNGREERGEPPRGPGYVYGAVNTLMLVAVAVTALSARTTTPPAIAELSPQALEQIEEAPEEQTSNFGSGEGGAAIGDPAAPSPTPTPAPTAELTTPPTSPPSEIEIPEEARVRLCVGDPPRQIDDPQSPKCVPFFDGDNGGATALGVTADEIRIAVPHYEPDFDPLLEAFFNNRFEFYGRKIRLVDMSDNRAGGEPEQQRASAQFAREQQVFASLPYTDGGGYFYHLELARQGVISVPNRSTFTEATMAQLRPYLYQYVMENAQLFEHLGDFVCQRLAGQSARFADDPLVAGGDRRFGLIVHSEQADQPVDPGPLLDRLTACEASPAVDIRIETDGPEGQQEDAILRLRQEGVTSVICLCQVVWMQGLTTKATGNGFFPEWVVSTYSLLDMNFTLRTFIPGPQLRNFMGISAQPMQRKPADHPSRWAARESDPNSQAAQTGIGAAIQDEFYRAYLLLASGIQLAGPNLTAETFEAGLMQADAFPNPFHPIMPGRVGFAGGSHSMTTDVAEWWWSEQAPSPYADEGVGSMCYVDAGARRTIGSFPAGDDPFFTFPCASGA